MASSKPSTCASGLGLSKRPAQPGPHRTEDGPTPRGRRNHRRDRVPGHGALPTHTGGPAPSAATEQSPAGMRPGAQTQTRPTCRQPHPHSLPVRREAPRGHTEGRALPCPGTPMPRHTRAPELTHPSQEPSARCFCRQNSRPCSSVSLEHRTNTGRCSQRLRGNSPPAPVHPSYRLR